MHFIDLDAEEWQSVLAFYKALLSGIGAPLWHGHSVNAVIDSIVWGK